MSRAYLEIVPKVQAYRDGMKKIPGITDEAAAAAAVKYERRLSAAMERAAKESERQAKKSAEFWADVSKIAGGVTLGGIASDVLSAGVGLVKDLGVAMYGMGKDALEAQDAVGDLAEDVGMAVDRVSALRFASIAAGEDFQQFGGTLSGFTVSVKKAQDGVSKQAKLFKLYGIEVKDAAGKNRDVNQVLDDTVARLQAIEDPGERAGAAMRLLGSEGAKMLRVLGDQTLADWSDRMRQAGIDVTAVAEASERWDAANRELKLSLEVAGQGLAAAFGTDAAGMVETLAYGIVTVGVVAEETAKVVDDAFSLKGMLNLAELLTALANPIAYATSKWAVSKVVGTNASVTAVDAFLDRVEARTEERMKVIREMMAVPEGKGGGGGGGGGRGGSGATVQTSSNRPTTDEELVGATIDTQPFFELAKALDEITVKLYSPARLSAMDEINARWDNLESQIRAATYALGEHDRTDELLKQAQIRRAAELKTANQEAMEAMRAASEATRVEISGDIDAQVAKYDALFSGTKQLAFQAAQEMVNSSKMSAVKQFNINKAFAVADIQMQGRRAQLTQFANAKSWQEAIVLAALTEVMTDASSAYVASQRITLHSGGSPRPTARQVGRNGPMGDEVDARLKDDEVVVDAPTARRVGGALGVRRRLERGGGGGGHYTFRLVLGAKEIGLIAEEVASRMNHRMDGPPRTMAGAR